MKTNGTGVVGEKLVWPAIPCRFGFGPD